MSDTGSDPGTLDLSVHTSRGKGVQWMVSLHQKEGKMMGNLRTFKVAKKEVDNFPKEKVAYLVTGGGEGESVLIQMVSPDEACAKELYARASKAGKLEEMPEDLAVPDESVLTFEVVDKETAMTRMAYIDFQRQLEKNQENFSSRKIDKDAFLTQLEEKVEEVKKHMDIKVFSEARMRAKEAGVKTSLAQQAADKAAAKKDAEAASQAQRANEGSDEEQEDEEEEDDEEAEEEQEQKTGKQRKGKKFKSSDSRARDRILIKAAAAAFEDAMESKEAVDTTFAAPSIEDRTTTDLYLKELNHSLESGALHRVGLLLAQGPFPLKLYQQQALAQILSKIKYRKELDKKFRKRVENHPYFVIAKLRGGKVTLYNILDAVGIASVMLGVPNFDTTHYKKSEKFTQRQYKARSSDPPGYPRMMEVFDVIELHFGSFHDDETLDFRQIKLMCKLAEKLKDLGDLNLHHSGPEDVLGLPLVLTQFHRCLRSINRALYAIFYKWINHVQCYQAEGRVSLWQKAESLTDKNSALEMIVGQMGLEFTVVAPETGHKLGRHTCVGYLLDKVTEALNENKPLAVPEDEDWDKRNREEEWSGPPTTPASAAVSPDKDGKKQDNAARDAVKLAMKGLHHPHYAWWQEQKFAGLRLVRFQVGGKKVPDQDIFKPYTNQNGYTAKYGAVVKMSEAERNRMYAALKAEGGKK